MHQRSTLGVKAQVTTRKVAWVEHLQSLMGKNKQTKTKTTTKVHKQTGEGVDGVEKGGMVGVPLSLQLAVSPSMA
jgi:hypothetical protein